MIKRYTPNIYFDFYVNAARKLDIKFTTISKLKTTATFFKKKKKLLISYALLGVNSEISARLAKNKFLCYQILDQKNLPHPKALVFKKKSNIKEILQGIRDIKKPWVVKPIKGMGGSGVSVNIQEISQLKKSIKFARKKKKDIIIEEYIHGSDYRILIFNNKIIDIVKRIPASIKGNTINTIQQLIEIKNKKRKKIGLKVIKIDQELKRKLKKDNLTLESKPLNNKIVVLRKNCNMSTGGETERIKLSAIPDDNKNLFIESVKLLGLNFAGIDFIIPDITKSYKTVRCAINEINRAPGLDAHYFADGKMDNFTAEEILKMYFNS